MDLKNKKVLLMGLGILGGGVATAKWLLGQGAVLTITDLKDAEFLKLSLEKLKDHENEIKFVLGEHKESDFLENDIIVINPDVPALNKFVELAREAGKQIENELTLFAKFCPSREIVAVTGTRGKTTTVNWIGHLLKSKNPNTLIVGNSPEKPLLQEIKNCDDGSWVVIEAPSFLLEICDESQFKPKVAVITNIYRDHINRHKSMEGYAMAKGNIFKYQDENDFLILNKENEWTEFFLNQKPKSKTLFFSKSDSTASRGEFIKHWGKHNFQNFAMASLVASIFGLSQAEIEKQIATLPQIKFRQEKVFDNEKLEIYNDTAATSPEATISAIERFDGKESNLILISGGTDRELEFEGWAVKIKEIIKPENLILLSGSATEKMKKALGWVKFQEFENLGECLELALAKASDSLQKNIILFSPSSKSFEKFKNEFDRGEKFNILVSKIGKGGI